MRECDDKEAFKEAVKEAANEWLDAKFAQFGKWTAYGIAAVLFAVFVKLSVSNGWWPK